MKLCRFKIGSSCHHARIGLTTDDATVLDLSAAGVQRLTALLESEDLFAVLQGLAALPLPRITGSPVAAHSILACILLAFVVAGVLTLAALVTMSWWFGMDLEYRFEVVAISITWIAVIVSSALLAGWLRRPEGADRGTQEG